MKTRRTADLKVIDNSDGTLTVINHSIGNVSYVDGNGQRIARGAGHLSGFEVLLDHAGTPTDPSDDVELDFEGLGGKFEVCPIIPAIT